MGAEFQYKDVVWTVALGPRKPPSGRGSSNLGYILANEDRTQAWWCRTEALEGKRAGNAKAFQYAYNSDDNKKVRRAVGSS